MGYVVVTTLATSVAAMLVFVVDRITERKRKQEWFRNVLNGEWKLKSDISQEYLASHFKTTSNVNELLGVLLAPPAAILASLAVLWFFR